MCFSLGASVASALAGAYAGGAMVWFLRSKLGTEALGDGSAAYLDAEEAQAGATLGALAFLPVLIQVVDAFAHARHQGLPSLPPAAVGTLGYLVTSLQPSALAIATALLLEDGGVAQIGLFVLAAVVALHALLCLSVAAPLESWLHVEVRPLFLTASERWKICALVHKWFDSAIDPGGWFGGQARGLVYFAGLSLATVAFVFKCLDLIERPTTDCRSDAHWCETIGWSMLVGAGVMWAALMLAAAIASSTIAGHTASLWCLLSLSGTYVAGMLLLRGQDEALYYWHSVLFFGVWLVAFALVSACVGGGGKRA